MPSHLRMVSCKFIPFVQFFIYMKFLFLMYLKYIYYASFWSNHLFVALV
uniref:Uncharacterized protein n=1 Tax=Arundo donax TaxID=35708 RepID=A0A0A9FTK4_ARUDO